MTDSAEAGSGSRMDVMLLPIPLPLTVEKLVAHLKKENRQPNSVEITFGPDALEALAGDRELLRIITSVERLNGLPVLFPERPGHQWRCLEVRMIGGDCYVQAGISVELLLRAYRSEHPRAD